MADQSVTHQLENELNAPAVDILEAIARGFRAKADVKGKLAELYLFRELESARQKGIIDEVTWNDEDGKPDFEIAKNNKRIIIECKNVRSITEKTKNMHGDGWSKVELQKTRNSKDPLNPTRGYSPSHFGVLAACLFNSTKRWEFRYILSSDLALRKDPPTLLEIYHKVHHAEGQKWTADLAAVLTQALQP